MVKCIECGELREGCIEILAKREWVKGNKFTKEESVNIHYCESHPSGNYQAVEAYTERECSLFTELDEFSYRKKKD